VRVHQTVLVFFVVHVEVGLAGQELFNELLLVLFASNGFTLHFAADNHKVVERSSFHFKDFQVVLIGIFSRVLDLDKVAQLLRKLAFAVESL